MKNWGLVPGVLLLGTLLSGAALRKQGASTDEEAIKAIYDRYSATVASKDINTIMSFYVPDERLVVFDAFPPRQYVGATAYRKDYESFFAAFPGPTKSAITDVRITMADTLAFAHRIDR